MASIEKIQAALDKYVDVVRNVAVRRDRWKSVTKPLLFDVLTEVQAAVKSNWYVDMDERMGNFETVCLTFETTPTGVAIATDRGSKGFPRRGGALSYSQQLNGQISAWIQFPFAEEVEQRRADEELALLEPSEITEALVLEHVERFVDEMARHDSTSRRGGSAAWRTGGEKGDADGFRNAH